MQSVLRLLLVALVALPGVAVGIEGAAWWLGHPVLPFLESLTGPWCHHDPTRTLHLGSRLLPVCARCTGLYGGLVAGPVVGLLLPRAPRRLLAVTVVCLLPPVVGLLLAFAEAGGAIATSNKTRLVLGALLTVGPIAWLTVGARLVAEVLVSASADP